MKKIIYNTQHVDNKDAYEVCKSLYQEKITTGKYVLRFEKNLKNFLRCKYIATTSSGTSAIDLAFKSICLKKNDVVIMPSINFISSYSMASQYGASIYLADVCSESGQINQNTILDCIKKNKIKKVKAIVVMYLGGYVEENIQLYKLKKKLKCYLIEDACHAFGAEYKYQKKNLKIGSCKHADLSTFSFHPLKTITTAEGGAVCTNNFKLFKNISLARSHGISRGRKYWDYEIKKLSSNYRLSDVNCALGVSQLKKIKKFLKKRKQIYLKYLEIYKNDEVFKIFRNPINCKSSYHLILVSLTIGKGKNMKEKLFRFMNKYNIFPQFHYKPIYKFAFNKKKVFKNIYRGTENYFMYSISFPIHYKMQLSDVKRVKSITDRFKKYYKL